MDRIEVALPVYDDEGIQVDTTSVYLTRDQVEDLVNAAAAVTYADRRVNETMGVSEDDNDSLGQALAELDEALVSYSVIEEIDE